MTRAISLVILTAIALSCSPAADDAEADTAPTSRLAQLLAEGEAIFGIFSGPKTPEQGATMAGNREIDFVFYSLESGPFDIPAMAAYMAGMEDDTDPLGSTMVIPTNVHEEHAADQRLQVGTILRDRFVLVEEVAGGSMGIVYKALDRRLAEADLPRPAERAEILSIYLTKCGRDPLQFPVDDLAQKAERLSGAELEQVVSAALYAAFDKHKELTEVELENAINDTVPLADTYEETIKELRDWARDRARPASIEAKMVDLFENRP